MEDRSALLRKTARSRQDDPEFSELSGLRLDIYPATVLFHDDVVAHRQTKPGPFTRRLSCEEWIEHLFLDLGRDARAVIANTDFHAVAEISRGCAEHWLEWYLAVIRLALGERVEPVRDQVQEYAGDLLRKQFERTGRLVELPPQGHVELRLLGTRAVIGKIKALIQQRIDVRQPMLAGTLARMQQHILDDGVGALAVLHNFFEIVLQHARQLVDFLPKLAAERR